MTSQIPRAAGGALPADAPAEGPTRGPLTVEELGLAARNHAMPLEALHEEITPPGLHYILTHFDIPYLDQTAWRLRVGGAVQHTLELSLADLLEGPVVTVPVTMECAGNGRSLLMPRPLSQPWRLGAVGTAEWQGVPLGYVLGMAGIDADALEVVFTGADAGIQGGVVQRYGRSLPVSEAMRPDVVLAYRMNGSALPPQHGFPVRLVVPGWYGMASVKWLAAIDVVVSPFEGFQQSVAYRYQEGPEDPGTPVTRIRVRSLMVPPGVPDFFTRRRTVPPGPVLLQGRAWSGGGTVERVEVGIDGQWIPAGLKEAPGPFAWRPWSCEWLAEPGEHVLMCRATDSTGACQPLDQALNYQGMGNNTVQKVHVMVEEAAGPLSHP